MININPAKAGEYSHIMVAETDDISSHYECASLNTKDGFPIFEESIIGGDVEIKESCDHYFGKKMLKADAVAALSELIHYIESSDDDQ